MSPLRPGDNTYSNDQEAQRAFWRSTVLPLFNRTAKALSAWLAPAWDATLDLRADLGSTTASHPHDHQRPETFRMTTLQTCRASPARQSNSIAMTVQAVERDGTFEGYASLFNREDMGRDVIAPGAFAESLGRRGPRGVKMLFQHDANQPIGVWQTIREDARGLYVTGRLIPQISKAREVHAMLQAGVLDGLSIGFRALAGKRDRRSGVRRLARIDLWEISIVTFPMLPDARVTAVKGRPRPRASPPPRLVPGRPDDIAVLARRVRAAARRPPHRRLLPLPVTDGERELPRIDAFSLSPHAGRGSG